MTKRAQAARFAATMEILGVPSETTEMLRPAPRRGGRGPSPATIRSWREDLEAIAELIELRGEASEELLAEKAKIEAKLAKVS